MRQRLDHGLVSGPNADACVMAIAGTSESATIARQSAPSPCLPTVIPVSQTAATSERRIATSDPSTIHIPPRGEPRTAQSVHLELGAADDDQPSGRVGRAGAVSETVILRPWICTSCRVPNQERRRGMLLQNSSPMAFRSCSLRAARSRESIRVRPAQGSESSPIGGRRSRFEPIPPLPAIWASGSLRPLHIPRGRSGRFAAGL